MARLQPLQQLGVDVHAEDGAHPLDVVFDHQTGAAAQLEHIALEFQNLAGTDVEIVQKTDYPWSGKVVITVQPAAPAEFDIKVRIPGWCLKPSASVNGKSVPL